MMRFIQIVLCYSSGCASQVRFPGFHYPSEPTPITLSISPCDQNQKFCENISDYPYDVDVDKNLLKNTLIRSKIFDKVSKSRVNNDESLIQTRFGSNQQEKVRACQVRRRQIFPTKAQNVKGEFLFIVNDARYRQSVEIEQCEYEGETCLTDNDAPFSGTTVCKQKYATYKLYAITAQKEQIYDSFSLPSACVCYYSSPSSLRIGPKLAKPTRRTSLPFCEAGSKLDLPRFVDNFSPSPGVTRIRSDTIPNKSRQERTSPKYSSSGDQFFYPPNNDEYVRRIPRYDSSRRNYATSSFRDYGRRRWSRDTRENDCDSSGRFCTNISDYPDNIARLLIAKNPAVAGNVFKQVFDDQCSSDSLITTRFSSNFDEEQLCFGSQRVIFPKKALNLNNEWKFVVNVDNFTQAVEVEECSQSQFSVIEDSNDTFGSCLYGGSSGRNPGRTSCKQIYTEHKLLSLSSSEDYLEVDRFLLPSACACYIAGSSNIQLKL